MEQNNFEKDIQQRLSELKIPPSDSVWDNVEKKIAKKKKDRKIIFILLFLIPFLLLGGYWLFNSAERSAQLQNHQLSNVEKKDSNTILPGSKQTNNTDSSSTHTAISSGIIPGNTGSPIISEEKEKVQSIKIQNETSGNISNKKQKNPSAKIDIKENDRIIFSSENEKENGKISIDVEKESKNVDQNNLSEKMPGIDNAKEKNNNSDSGIIAENKITADTSLKNIVEKLATKKDSSAKKSYKGLPKHKWSFGITFSGGKSMRGENPLGINNVNNNYVQNMPGGGSVSTPPVYPPSEIKGSVAFIGGVFIEKNISAKSKISLGISYRYFSLLNKVGNRMDSLISFPLPNSSTSGTLYSSANNAHTYRNNFHYLEIPISVRLQLGNNKTLPLYWDAGINISQLISSNALQYQSGTGIYYNDNSFFNKTQLGLQTGLSLTLFAKQKNPFTIGPYFSYNASDIADKGLYEKKYFSFIGIHTEILFKRK